MFGALKPGHRRFLRGFPSNFKQTNLKSYLGGFEGGRSNSVIRRPLPPPGYPLHQNLEVFWKISSRRIENLIRCVWGGIHSKSGIVNHPLEPGHRRHLREFIDTFPADEPKILSEAFWGALIPNLALSTTPWNLDIDVIPESFSINFQLTNRKSYQGDFVGRSLLIWHRQPPAGYLVHQNLNVDVFSGSFLLITDKRTENRRAVHP